VGESSRNTLQECVLFVPRHHNWPSPQTASEPLHHIRHTEDHIAYFPTPAIIWLDFGNWTKGISGLLTFVRSSVRSWHTYVLQSDITAHVWRTPDNWNRRKRSTVPLTLASTAPAVITRGQMSTTILHLPHKSDKCHEETSTFSITLLHV
jgi:hypothetical protein